MGSTISENEFLIRAKKVHGDKYDYSKLDYHRLTDKGVIICPIHGEFSQILTIHVHAARGCPECGGSVKRTRETFEMVARKIHGDKYDYSKVIYSNNKSKVTITCRDCNKDFDIRPDSHINGKGCVKCGYDKSAKNRALSKEQFVFNSKLIHGDIYDYSVSNYINTATKINILCRSHGEFEQTPSNHMSGVGCPVCKLSRGELSISDILNQIGIEYKTEMTFDDCINPITGSNLYFDFYIPSHNMCIEYDGEQHYISNEFFGGQSAFLLAKERDLIKTKYCMFHNIFLYRLIYLDRNNIDYILKKLLL